MNNKKKVLIIGTGLAGYGACMALLEKRNIEIDVADIGLEKPYKGQSNHKIPNSKDINKSFFPYGINDERWSVRLTSERICSSHAMGGFSKVWSGSILRPHNEDLLDWPKESFPKTKDYKSIIKSINVAQRIDSLNEVFPNELTRIKKKGSKSVYFGRSRIAYINKISNNGVQSSIPFDPSESFQNWFKKGLISYKKNQYVTHIIKENKFLNVFIEEDNNLIIKKYDFVFLGAGCVNTTAIIDRSIYGEGERKYKIKIVPFLLQILFKVPSINAKSLENLFPGKDLYGLCKFFLENRSRSTSFLWSHTQIGIINRIIINKITEIIPSKLKFLVDIIRKFFWFSITTFHSSLGEESTLISKVFRNNNHYRQSILIRENETNCSNDMYLSTKFAIISKFLHLKLIPFPFSKYIDEKLRGNKLGNWHFGGTLPMKKNPTKPIHCFASGELAGLEGLFIIDTSSFPSIPGCTIGLLTMANAYRIARKSFN